MVSELQIKKETEPELIWSVVFHRALGAMEPERRGAFIPANWLTDLEVVYRHTKSKSLKIFLFKKNS